MKNTIEIKINSTSATAKCIGIVRKYSTLSISEIKNHINNHEQVLSCDYTDDERIPLLINCYNELTDANIPTELYEHSRKCNVDFLHNLCELYADISKQIDEEILSEDGI